jgi:hypothetical protein
MLVKGRIILLAFFFVIISRSSFSQDHDFGIWYAINTEASITKKLELDVSAMIRTFTNASKTEQFFLEAGTSYKFSKYISVAGSYRLSNMLEDDDQYHVRHKFLTDLKGTIPLSDFSFSARLRLQMQSRTYIEDVGDDASNFTGRFRVKCLYNIPKFPVNPYVCIETFSSLFEESEKIIGKERFTAGFEYKIIKKHSIEAEYIFERDFIPKIADISIIAINYNVKF